MLDVTLVGIPLSSGFFWSVKVMNPVGGAVSSWIPLIIAFLISADWGARFFLSLIFQGVAPNLSWMVWRLIETSGFD